MVKTLQGQLDGRGLRFGLVLPRFNEVFGARLLSGAVDCLVRHGAAETDLTVIRVPGTFEIPAAVHALVAAQQVDAVIALGVLIRGATSHYDHLALAVSRRLAEEACGGGPAVVYGIVTAENQEQAMERCGGKVGNRGWEAALAAIEMGRLLNELNQARGR
ncbi:MAG: 6,7-dimethyl-8-ribityllumazine synthase [Acidobacteriota bacterium]